MKPPEQLIIFVKAPRAGYVKTRLAASLGQTGAALAYRTLVETLISRFARFGPLELRYAPDDALAEIQPWLKENWTAHPQGSGDLGQRLRGAFENSFAAGARKIVVIGSDCPFVEPEDIRAAWSALSDHEVVLGPATDGGYWLVGLRRPHWHLFENISWSTKAVLAETLARCKASGLRAVLLRELTDVDTKEDWQAFVQSLISPHV